MGREETQTHQLADLARPNSRCENFPLAPNQDKKFVSSEFAANETLSGIQKFNRNLAQRLRSTNNPTPHPNAGCLLVYGRFAALPTDCY